MTVQNYLMVNESTNIVDNDCLWDGDVDTWQPPSGYLLIIQATTIAMVWALIPPSTTYELTEKLGGGGNGFTYDPITQIVTTNQPQPTVLPA